MYDAHELLKVIKQAAMEAVEAARPVAVCNGTVTSMHPIKIRISSKILLTERQLIKCREIKEMKEDDDVLLLREQGGQNYIILGVIE